LLLTYLIYYKIVLLTRGIIMVYTYGVVQS